jgi:hypothetical protein
MSTTAMLLGYMAPAALKVAKAQTVPFPPCVNDFRAEIATGQRSQHYPRCLDAHSPSGPTLIGAPQGRDALSCPAGQVYSGGACVTIQNQAGYGPAWTSFFLGQKRCKTGGYLLWYSGRNDLACATVTADGSVRFTIEAPGGHVHQTVGTAPAPFELAATALVFTWPCGMEGGSATATFRAWPNMTNNQLLRGQNPTDFTLDNVASGCPANGSDSGSR